MEHHLELTLEFFQGLISESEPEVLINSIKVTTGAGRGDNYTSMLYRVRAEGITTCGKAWSKSFICKCLPVNRARREAFKSEILFRNEVAFYTRSLPALTAFQASRGHTIFQEVPKVYLAKSHILVLEDMKEKGFIMADRKKALDLQHCEAVLRTLGHFHGLSLALKCGSPKEFASEVTDQISECLFREEYENWYEQYYKRAGENAKDMIAQTMSGNLNSQKYLHRFAEFMDSTFFRRMVTHVKSSNESTELATLCHGDCWTNNFLFQYSDAGTITKLCIVDFQFARYASPALDLVQLLFICTTRALRSAHLDHLLQLYSGSLYDSLRLLGCCPDVFGGEDELFKSIKTEFHRCSQVGLGLAVDMIPICNCDSDEAPDLYVHEQQTSATQHEKEAFQAELSSSDVCRVRMTDLIMELVDADVI